MKEAGGSYFWNFLARLAALHCFLVVAVVVFVCIFGSVTVSSLLVSQEEMSHMINAIAQWEDVRP